MCATNPPVVRHGSPLNPAAFEAQPRLVRSQSRSFLDNRPPVNSPSKLTVGYHNAPATAGRLAAGCMARHILSTRLYSGLTNGRRVRYFEGGFMVNSPSFRFNRGYLSELFFSAILTHSTWRYCGVFREV